MVKLNEILNLEILNKLIDDGFISRKIHKDYPLAILNYTPQAQYDPKLEWGVEMNLSRGLIYCIDTLEVVARPFPKFWNLGDSRHPETMPENLPDEVPIFLEKLDGSMGVLFEWEGLNHVATRGSFHSEQAEWATNWLRLNYSHLKLPKEVTLVSEIIYSENKIVVDYDFEGLVILAAINKYSGHESPRSDLKPFCTTMGLPLVKEYKTSISQALTEDEKNREGYVVTYPSTGLKVKVKFEEYCRLHKVLTGLSVHSVWELLRDGNAVTIEEWLDDSRMPVTFKTWVNGVRGQLIEKYETIHNEVKIIYENRPTLDVFMPFKESRKKMAEYFTNLENRKYSGLLFGLLDEKNIEGMIWKMIEPSGNAVYRVDGE